MKRVPLRKCRRCVHFRRETCHLADLEPCTFVPTDEAKDNQMRTRIGLINTAIVIALIAALLAFGGCKKKPEPTFIPKWSAVELLRNQHKDELTEWQMLQMAIMMTESKFTAEAVGAVGDRGVLQLVPSYVAEANRLAGTAYTPEDAHDIGKALEMFDIIQSAYNPDHDIEAGIYHHNKNIGYAYAVKQNLELVRRYELCRQKIREYGK